jgi:hypothetical protein
VTFECRLSGDLTGEFRACAGPQSYSDLADGQYSFEVYARDAVGNVSEVATRTFTVDTVAPQLQFSAPTPAQGTETGSSPKFAWSASEAASFSCRLDGEPFGACTSPVALSGLAAGGHTFHLRAMDAAGNIGTASRTFQVVAPKPPVTPPAPPVAGPVPAPKTPSVAVINERTGRELTIRIAGIHRRIDLAELRRAGLRVTVVPAEGTRLIRFRIFRAGARAAGSRRPLITLYRRVNGSAKRTITLKVPRRVARRLRAGRYVLEVTPGADKRRLGKPSRRTFAIRERPAR